jgi:hypothetical protein
VVKIGQAVPVEILLLIVGLMLAAVVLVGWATGCGCRGRR